MPATVVSNASIVNTSTVTVNGVTSTGAPIVNTNTLTATNGSLVSTVNGVASTPAVAVLTAANNGLTATNGTVLLGGALTGATVVTASAANTLAIAGLQASSTSTDQMVVADATTGVLRTIAQPVSNISVKNVSITIPATAIGHTYATTVTVTGALVGNNVIVNPRAALPDGVSIAYARVSAANTVEIGFQGPGSSQVTGAGFDIKVMP